MAFKSFTSIDDTNNGLINRDKNIHTSGDFYASNTTKPTMENTKPSTSSMQDNTGITSPMVHNMEQVQEAVAHKKLEVDFLLGELDDASNVTSDVYQISKSADLRSKLFEELYNMNNEIYLFSLEVEDYTKLTVKDASLLKQSLREKIMANLGD